MQHAQQPTWLSHVVFGWMCAVQINTPYVTDCIQKSVGLWLRGSQFHPKQPWRWSENVPVLQREQALSPTQ